MSLLRTMSLASWSPRTFLKLARLCHPHVRRFSNDNWHPVSAA